MLFEVEEVGQEEELAVGGAGGFGGDEVGGGDEGEGGGVDDAVGEVVEDAAVD